MCWVSLWLFFSLFGWVFSSCLFPGERWTSFGDKRLNTMNKCLVLPVWTRRLVPVVKITVMAVWREERFFPGMINRELGKNSSLQQGSSISWGSHFCRIFPNNFPAMSLGGSVSTKAIFFPSASGILRAVHLKVNAWNVSEESHLEAPASASRRGRLARWIPPKSGLFSWWTIMRLMGIELRYICVIDVHVLVLWIRGDFSKSLALLLLISFTHQQWETDTISLGKDKPTLSVKQFSPNSQFEYGEQLWTSRKTDKGGWK